MILSSIMEKSYTTWISLLCISTSASTCEKKLHIYEAFQFPLHSEWTIESVIRTRIYFMRYMIVLNPSVTKSLPSFCFHCNTLGFPSRPAAFWIDRSWQNICHYQFHFQICFFPCHFLYIFYFFNRLYWCNNREEPKKGK